MSRNHNNADLGVRDGHTRIFKPTGNILLPEMGIFFLFFLSYTYTHTHMYTYFKNIIFVYNIVCIFF